MSPTAAAKKAVQAVPELPESDAGPEPETILELSTAAPLRPLITIDDQPYEMALMGDFGIVEQQLISREGAEFQRLWNRDALNAKQQARLKDLCDRQFAKVLLGVPKSVAAKLNDEHRAAVVLTFMLEPLRRAQVAAMEQQAQAREIADWVAELVDRDLDVDEAAQLAVLLQAAVERKNNTKQTP